MPTGLTVDIKKLAMPIHWNQTHEAGAIKITVFVRVMQLRVLSALREVLGREDGTQLKTYIEDILARCIQNVQAGKPMDDVLKAYPDQASAPKPLFSFQAKMKR